MLVKNITDKTKVKFRSVQLGVVFTENPLIKIRAVW